VYVMKGGVIHKDRGPQPSTAASNPEPRPAAKKH